VSVLLDTNILLARGFPRDNNHNRARSALHGISSKRIIVSPVLSELFYLFTQRLSYSVAIESFDSLRTGAYQIEVLTDQDMARMSEIMRDYQDNAFDFVDTAIMAIAERLNITTIYTLDRRDFETFRPRHCQHFDLLP
jgi:uncharacterized protein